MIRTKTGIFLALIVILVLINFSIYQKEQHLAHGRTVCLRLAPVDPRSLMQGDYMRLRFALADTLRSHIPHNNLEHATNGYALLDVEANCTVSFVDLYHGQTLEDGQAILHYRVRNTGIKIATNAFFFREGTSKRYTPARYGLFKVNAQGDPLLTHLLDNNLHPLGAKPSKKDHAQ